MHTVEVQVIDDILNSTLKYLDFFKIYLLFQKIQSLLSSEKWPLTLPNLPECFSK